MLSKFLHLKSRITRIIGTWIVAAVQFIDPLRPVAASTTLASCLGSAVVGRDRRSMSTGRGKQTIVGAIEPPDSISTHRARGISSAAGVTQSRGRRSASIHAGKRWSVFQSHTLQKDKIEKETKKAAKKQSDLSLCSCSGLSHYLDRPPSVAEAGGYICTKVFSVS